MEFLAKILKKGGGSNKNLDQKTLSAALTARGRSSKNPEIALSDHMLHALTAEQTRLPHYYVRCVWDKVTTLAEGGLV